MTSYLTNEDFILRKIYDERIKSDAFFIDETTRQNIKYLKLAQLLLQL